MLKEGFPKKVTCLRLYPLLSPRWVQKTTGAKQKQQ